MAYLPLSDLSDWQLVHGEQDIRGLPVVDSNGATAAHVAELLVDTESQLVEAVRLDDGREIPVRDVEIVGTQVHVRGMAPVQQPERSAGAAGEPGLSSLSEMRIHRRLQMAMGTPGRTAASVSAAGTPVATSNTEGALNSGQPFETMDYATHFRTHYTTALDKSDYDYSFYEPGYVFGHEAAADERYRDREFAEAEAELRREYEARHGRGAWDPVREAAHHSYQHRRVEIYKGRK